MRRAYSLLMRLLQPLVRRKLARRAVDEPLYGHAVAQRFGDYRNCPPLPLGPPVLWVHAVSLGETRAAGVLLQQLRVLYPTARLLLTHGTATGWAQGQTLMQPGDVQAWQPWDTPAAVSAFLAHYQPRLGLLMETEVWPNLVAGCVVQQIPLYLLNARLSDKSLQQALRLRWLARPAYQGLRGVWAQTEDDARRLRQLGAPVLGVTGNLKFDAHPDAAQLQRAADWRALQARPLVMFAASRDGEEVQFLDALLKLDAQQRDSVQWLIVPRHPQRFAQVAALIVARGLTLSRRSSWVQQPQQASVWLGDSMGEMTLYFGMADLALLGGSFAPLGGQNLIEAAACGCTVIMGPHTFNFADAAMQAERAGAALRVLDLSSAMVAALALLQQPAALAERRRQALHWSQAHRGAAERTLQALAPSLASRITATGR